ncbi:MAG: permease [Candidatus Kaiserbacteria bacterium]|nr:permease [Candidatus Kaiserbacteria bacterium]
MQEISLTVDGIKLNGKIFRYADSNTMQPGALIIHGWESKQDRMFMLAEALAQKGYCCLTVDMRGHGASEGDHKTFSRKDFLKDVVAAYDFLVAQENIDTEDIIAIGSSFGSYLISLLSAERKLKAIVLRVPADYRDEGFDKPLHEQRGQESHSMWKEQPHTNTETAALRAIHNFDGSLLIVESEKDELVPVPTLMSYVQAAPNPAKLRHVLMANAPHSISHHPELQRQFADIVSDWLNSLK